MAKKWKVSLIDAWSKEYRRKKAAREYWAGLGRSKSKAINREWSGSWQKVKQSGRQRPHFYEHKQMGDPAQAQL